MKMKTCEKCGKKLYTLDDVFTRNGKTLCEECAVKYDGVNYDDLQRKIEYTNLQTTTTTDIASNFWVRFMKSLTIIVFIVFLLASFRGAVAVGYVTNNFGWGFLAFLGLTFLSILSVAFTMIFLHLAEDVSIIRKSINKDK